MMDRSGLSIKLCAFTHLTNHSNDCGRTNSVMRARIFGTRSRIVQNVIGSARTRVLLTFAVGGA